MLLKIYNGLLNIKAIIMSKAFYHSKISFGKGVRIRKRFNVTASRDAQIIIGNNCFFNNDCSLNAREKISIGENTIIGENVKMYDHNHRFNQKGPKYEQGFTKDPITIGKNCWIGSNVTILKGVHIGDNTVIGAGITLKKSVKEDSIVTSEISINTEKIRYK